MKPVLFVTVGTSLYESATWDPAKEPAVSLRGYRAWTIADGADATLLSPDNRRLHSQALLLRAQLVEKLTEVNGEEWAGALPEELFGVCPEAQAMRYSAEVATLLLFAQDHRRNLETLRQFLVRHEIRIAFDPTERESDRPRAIVAARHLIAILRRLAPEGAVEALPIEGLSSPDPKQLLAKERGLGAFLSEVRKEASRDGTVEKVTIILSGGFKIYGILLGHLLGQGTPNLRLVYIHESGTSLVEVDSHGVAIGKATSSWTERGGIES